MTALTCPYCNTAFDLPGIPGRIVCPRCGEAIPSKLLPANNAPAMTVSTQAAPVESAPKVGLRPVTIFGVLLLSAVIAGLGIWYFNTPSKPSNKTVDGVPIPPPPTRPPLTLPGLLYLPTDTNAVLMVQPLSVIQFAERAGKTPEELLAEWGMPVGLFAGLQKAGIPLSQIDHVVFGVALPDVGFMQLSIVLSLRGPIESERQFREVVKYRQNADKLGRAAVELPGLVLPMEMHKFDEKTYLFSSDGKALDGMVKPKENPDFLKPGVRESIKRIDPASFAWLATDNLDWGNLPALKLGATLLKQPELPKRLKGVRALAIGLSLHPGLIGQAHVRFADPNAAKEFETKSTPKITDARIEIRSEREWLTVGLPGPAFTDGIPAVLGLFEK